MNAVDIMTRNVITAKPEMSVQAVARLLCEHGISGVPVVDADDRLVGIVTEGDLLRRVETDTESAGRRDSGRWWLDLFADGRGADLRAYVKSRARRVEDVMTREVASVGEKTALADVAALLETRQIKRVPVVRGQRVVGIISRSNLVRALAAVAARPEPDGADDASIRNRLLAEIKRIGLGAAISPGDIIVRDRVVHLWILDNLASPEERAALRVAAENIPGVTDVRAYLVPASTVPGWYKGR